MSDLLTLIALALVAVGLIALGWWLLIESEGVYLGRRVVVWLYDVYADRYDDIKHFRQEYDHMYLAQPILERIAPQRAPLVLDVATGTARMPIAYLRHAHFQGRIVGADLSRKMLAKAAAKLGNEPRVTLLWTPAERLPFANDTFDVVTCLEALEFMEQPEAAMAECVRVLRPGGLLLLTNRINTRLMPGKTMTDETMQALLESLGMAQVEPEYWQVDYNRIWGLKAGQSLPTGARSLVEILRCPQCDALLDFAVDRYTCPSGHFSAPIATDRVVEMGASVTMRDLTH